MNETFDPTGQAAPVLIQLLKGVLYRDLQENLWQDLMNFQAVVRNYFAIIGLELILDEAEGYAFLRQRDFDAEQDNTVPRLVPRRQLSYPQSLLLVMLRKRLVEQDTAGSETRVILSRTQIVDMMRVFLPDSSNEAKAVEQINRHINKILDYGFLRKLRGEEEHFEVRRIIKSLVNADWLSDLEGKLAEYRSYVKQQ